MNELINILIRHKQGREEMLKRCLESVWAQTFKNYRIIVSFENEDSLETIEEFIWGKTDIYFVDPNQHYNLHCNNLKELVHEGYFFYLDDDDVLASSTVLEELMSKIKEPAVYICQFLRNGIPKPSDRFIEQGIISKGRIGGGCAVVHHSFKDAANWKAKQAADFDWIMDMKNAGVPFRFLKIILQKTFRKGNGK